MENTVIQNAGFHHLALYASDFDRTMEFYCKGLGCGYDRGWGEGTGRAAMVDFGGGNLLEIFAKGTGKEQENARFIHLAIATTDPDRAYEAALMNTKMAIPEQPLEILRTLHSFDPCLACSTHVLGDDGSELISVQVR